MSPEGTRRDPQLWRDCCVAHDLRLWGGGTRKERNKTDMKIKSCIEKKAGPTIARIYFDGIRLGRLSPWNIPSMRWGNAWYAENGKNYWRLTKAQIERLISEVALMKDLKKEIRDEYTRELKGRLKKR
jgi:hypothetical protein